MHRIDRKKVFIGFGILIVTILLWPLLVSIVVVSPKIEAQKEILAGRGMELRVDDREGYFSSKREYFLTVTNREKFLTFLSGAIKVDPTLLGGVMPEQNDVLGLQFGGEITTKVWQPFSVSVYMEPKDFPKNQLKLLEYKSMLQKFGAAFIFNLRGKLKEVDLNDIDLNSNQFGINNKIKNITRIASGTCLDNFVTNLEGIFSVTNLSIADHLAIKAKIKLKKGIKNTVSDYIKQK
jgi:hypothetical protein